MVGRDWLPPQLGGRLGCPPIRRARRLGRCGIGLIWLGLTFASAGAARADLVRANVPLEILDVGGVCFSPPDRKEPAPDGSGGEVWFWDGLRIFAVHGDIFPARPGLGIKLRVRLGEPAAGSTISVQVTDPEGYVNRWELVIDDDGVVEFGHAPYEKELLPTGRYELQAFDGQRLLFSYLITVDGYGDNSPCEPQIS